MTFEIKEGGFYRARNGEKIGPMIVREYAPSWPWGLKDVRTRNAQVAAWRADGTFNFAGGAHDLDLIAEWDQTVLAASSPEALTQERKKTHGDWKEQSALANTLKGDMRKVPGWAELSASEQEALDMIQTKVSRILSGDPREPDHWDDIAGYAHLGKSGHTA